MTDMTHGLIAFESNGVVARITLNNPDNGNAFDLPMAEDFLEAVEKVCAACSDGLRVVVLDAAGPMFCVGGDLQSFAAAADRSELMDRVTSRAHRAIELLTSAPVPVVTIVQGTAAGGGIGIVLAGDIIIAADSAKFKMAYTAAGLSPDFGTTSRLSRDIGLARALDLTLTNRVFTGTEAQSWGLISRAVDPPALHEEARSVVELLAAGPTRAYGAAKHLLRTSNGKDLATQLDREAASITTLVDEPAAHEGIDAFLTRRTPQFT
jgi:2-(1,2-epoxy-1,2-dihydrophenyl)acetyl-CoA isomerase